MSSIKINTSCISESNGRLVSALKSISSASQAAALIRSRLPSQVLTKNGIGQAFDSMERDLEHTAQKIADLKKEVDNAAAKYKDTDYKCSVKARELTGVIRGKYFSDNAVRG